MVKPQWWINCKQVAARAVEDVKVGNLKIIPEFQKKSWNEFLENIRDWCISRQLWWGHRCPAYLVSIKGVLETPDNSNNEHWIAANSEEEARAKASKKWNVDESLITLSQDEDVLDTWFSSGLLPFSVFGWPDTNHEELKAFFPTDLLETGHDIIFFWVARMVFMSYFFLNQLPFHTVFLHPIVRDSEGRKMSKSLGNVIDPLEVIDGITYDEIIRRLKEGNLPESELKRSIEEKKKEFSEGIPACGADALRLGLLSYLIQGKNINLEISRVISYRFFGNKIWNAYKFLDFNIEKDFKLKESLNTNDELQFIDRWILNKLSKVTRETETAFLEYNLGDAALAVYSFWFDCICDVYIEAFKNIMKNEKLSVEAKNNSKNVLVKVIDSGLKLLHPLMPFITEELYQRLPKPQNSPISICISEFPNDVSWENSEIDSFGTKILDISHKILSVMSQFTITAKADIAILTNDKSFKKLIENETGLLATLSKVKSVVVLESREDTLVKGWLVNVIDSSTDVYLNIRSLININEEEKRLNDALTNKQAYYNEILEKTTQKDYESKVPEKVKLSNKEKLESTSIEIQKIKDSLTSIKNITSN